MGLFTLVLHTHLPYLRRNGVSPCGEDFFHEAAFECYLPLLDLFERLWEKGVRAGVTLGVTPVLAGQMEDAHMLRELRLYLASVELRAWRLAANHPHDPAVRLAGAEAVRAREALGRLERLSGGIASAYAALARKGAIEIAGGPASHALLPRIGGEELVRMHVAAGIAEHTRVLGAPPVSFWLPECAYAPDRGIEEVLERSGVGAFLVDGGPAGPVLAGTSEVAAFSIDRAITDLVWSSPHTYPPRPEYRDFHAREWESGFKVWSVTDRTAVWPKRPYDPAAASVRARADAHDFIARLDRRFGELDPGAVVVAAFDTELFGHWWHEGPAWLEHVLVLLADHPRIRVVTLSEALAAAAPSRHAILPASTWGDGGDERSWVAPESLPMWEAVAEAERTTLRLARRAADAPAFDQLLRELLLLSSSDWPFMLIRRTAGEYGRERFEAHLERHAALCALLERDDPQAAAAAAALREIDNPFPDLAGARAALSPASVPPA